MLHSTQASHHKASHEITRYITTRSQTPQLKSHDNTSKHKDKTWHETYGMHACKEEHEGHMKSYMQKDSLITMSRWTHMRIDSK